MTESVLVVPDGPDQAALVGLLQAAGHFFGPAEAASVVAIGMVQRTLKGVGIHICQNSAMTLWAALAG